MPGLGEVALARSTSESAQTVALRADTKSPERVRALMCGGPGRNRTTDTRIFNPEIISFYIIHRHSEKFESPIKTMN